MKIRNNIEFTKLLEILKKMLSSVLNWFKKKNFADFSWLKTTSFIELESIDVKDDPVRPELDLAWRKSFLDRLAQKQAAYPCKS